MSFINLEEIGFKDGYSLDAFARLRQSGVVSLFDSQPEYSIGPRDWSMAFVGAGTYAHLNTQSTVELSTGGTTDGDSAVRQTRLCWRYQSGKSLMLFQMFNFGAAATNVRKRIGLFDANDGAYLEQNDTDIRAVLRTSTSGSPDDSGYVVQANWSEDPLDGSGPSGVTLDFTKVQFMFIDLGAGRVRFGFYIDGIPIIAHQFSRSNSVATAYIRTPNLPVRGEIANVGTALGAATLKMVVTSVMVEGGSTDFQRGNLNTASNGTTPININSRTPIISVRPAATYFGLPNRAWAIPIEALMLVSGNDIFWEAVFGATLTGASWNAVASDSCMEYDTSATAVSGGVVVISGYAAAGQGSSSGSAIASVSGRFPISVDSLLGTQQGYTLVATPMTGTADVAMAVDWREIY